MTAHGRTALVAGANGAVGTALARELAGTGWRTIGLSRHRPAEPVDGVEYLEGDLGEPAALSALTARLAPVTHAFHCARVTHAEQPREDVPGNLALLDNLLDAVTVAAPGLEHVHVVQGGKYYGVHLGPFATPAREDQSRAAVENFNHAHEDRLRARAADAGWTWSASRPNTLLHFSPGNPRNIVGTLGAYAALCRADGRALDFPGPPGAYESITQFTTLALLARAIAWMSTEATCANRAFNVVNTDVTRWRNLWPRLAAAFDVPTGEVRPVRVAETLAAAPERWRRLAADHDLREPDLALVANGSFADATLERDWDEILSHNRLRAAGFDGWDDTELRFTALLETYRRERWVP